ncbi:MAG: hypothetical protein Q9159_000408 [Coniocarpon cinnabarinum]
MVISATSARQTWNESGEIIHEQPQPSTYFHEEIEEVFRSVANVSQMIRLLSGKGFLWTDGHIVQITPAGQECLHQSQYPLGALVMVCQAWPTPHLRNMHHRELRFWWSTIGPSVIGLVQTVPSSDYPRKTIIDILLDVAIATEASLALSLLFLATDLLKSETRCVQHRAVDIQLAFLNRLDWFNSSILHEEPKIVAVNLQCVERNCQRAMNEDRPLVAKSLIGNLLSAFSNNAVPKSKLVCYTLQSTLEYAAWALNESRDFKRARQCIDLARTAGVPEAPTRLRLAQHLALVLYSEGNPSGARESLGDCMNEPTLASRELRLNFAELSLLLGDMDSAEYAINDYTSFNASLTSFSNIRVQVIRARIAHMRGDLSSAADLWNMTVQVAGGVANCSSTVCLSLIHAYALCGNSECAGYRSSQSQALANRVNWGTIWGFETIWREWVIGKREKPTWIQR